MSAEMKNKVKDLLKTYNERERKIALLQFQMENPPLVTLNEQIEAMNYGHGDGLGHTQGRVSNKTLFIALNYEEQAERLNAQASSEIAVSSITSHFWTSDRQRSFVCCIWRKWLPMRWRNSLV